MTAENHPRPDIGPFAMRPGYQPETFDEQDIHAFIEALRRSKAELDIARQQFENVVDPLLIDHVVFRLGAAERHFNYLFQLARQLGLRTGGIRWDWSGEGERA